MLLSGKLILVSNCEGSDTLPQYEQRLVDLDGLSLGLLVEVVT